MGGEEREMIDVMLAVLCQPELTNFFRAVTLAVVASQCRRINT